MFEKSNIIDLSQPIEKDMPVVATLPKTYIGLFHRHDEAPLRDLPPNVSFATSIIMMSDHAGTHIDSTYHYNPEGHTVDQIPLKFLCCDGIVLDFSHKKPGDCIALGEAKTKCKEVGEHIGAGDIVLFYTGACKKWNTPDYLQHLVQIKKEVVEWLIEQGVRVFGIDTASPDIPPCREVHMLMKEKDYYHIENLANLDKIPTPRFKFIGLPLKLVGATASPIRAVAIVEGS